MRRIVLLASLVLNAATQIRCKCDVPLKIYEDLRCVPIYNHTDASDASGLLTERSCPQRYDCSNLTARPDKRCYFDGEWYNVGDFIQVPSVCGVGVCQCMASLNFDCSKRECPYLHLPDVNQCFLAYELGKCCAETIHCVAAPERTNLTKCEVANTVYLEGELFRSPLDGCKLCVCTSTFDTNYGHNVCRSVPCRKELLRSATFVNFCAPVYMSETDCCPVDVRCPSAADIKAFADKDLDVDADESLHCTYGSVKVPLGVRLLHNFDQYGHITITDCECRIPPFMTCYRTYY